MLHRILRFDKKDWKHCLWLFRNKELIITDNNTDLEYELENMDKSKIIKLFIKLKDINSKMAARINLLENQLDELTDLDALIESIK